MLPGRFGFYSYSQQNSVFTNFNYRLRVDFLADRNQVCEGETVNFTSIDPECSPVPYNIESFEWDFGDGTSSNEVNPEHAFLTAGTYPVKLTVTDQQGCQDSSFSVVTVHAYPLVDLGTDTLLPYGGSLSLDAGNTGAVYAWSTGASSQSIVLQDLKEDTLVFVTVNRHGCTGRDEIMIRVEPPPVSRIYVPNAFTPDGDGLNDDFGPVLVNVGSARLMIFDRWGKMLFQTSEVGSRWKGKCGPIPCPDGVYVWKLVYDARLEDETIEQRIEVGTVALIR